MIIQNVNCFIINSSFYLECNIFVMKIFAAVKVRDKVLYLNPPSEVDGYFLFCY